MSRNILIRAIKLGGSLLELRDWPDRLQNWVGRQSLACNCLLIGGGPPVDAIRDMPNVSDYPDELLHWMCVDLMDFSHRLAQFQLGGWHTVNQWQELSQAIAEERSHILVNVRTFYTRDVEPGLEYRLPLNWDTTSDSLAALLATLLRADELVLIKSCGPVEQVIAESGTARQNELQDLAHQGAVDRALASLGERLPSIRIVNLRADQ